MNTISTLAILQQSEYELPKVEVWLSAHSADKKIVEPEKWTFKLKWVWIWTQLLFFLPVVIRFKIALFLFYPFEQLVRKSIYFLASMKRQIIKQHAKVVIIAGSYGKTSTKHILSHSFDASLSTISTPKSVNTMLGLALFLLRDVRRTHHLIILELGEYNPGDVKKITQFVKPDFAVITPIGAQHLERFSSLEMITKEFQSLVNYFKNQPENILISEKNNLLKLSLKMETYGNQQKSAWHIQRAEVTRSGTEFKIPQISAPIFTPIFGSHQAENMLTSFWLANRLAISEKKIVQALAVMPFIERRHEPHFIANDILLLDNSYNTNPNSIISSLKLLNEIPGAEKAIATLGFVELGKESAKEHQKLGKMLAKQVQFAAIITSPHAHFIIDSFLKAGGKKSHILEVDNYEAAVQWLLPQIKPHSVILFEGGYQELHQ